MSPATTPQSGYLEYGINWVQTLCLILILRVYMIDLLPGAKLHISDNNIDAG